MSKKISLFIICIILIITQTSCNSQKSTSKTDFYLNTTCTIEIRGMSESKANNLIDEAFEKISYYEGLLSRTITTSDIYKLNNASGNPVELNEETVECIEAGIKKCQESDGEFDITIGQLTDLWNFSGEDPSVPDEAEIKSTLSSIDYTKIKIDGNTVQLLDPDAWIDLGAIAKGFIADKISTMLVSEGVESGIVNLGGNIVAIGDKTDGTPWNIGLEAPYSDRSEIYGSIKMSNQTVVTSGTYERYFVEDGVSYHHVLDPDTGYPEDTDIVAVSILGPIGTSTECDGYSTTCLLLGTKNAVEFMKDKTDFEYCILDIDGNITKSDGFDLIKEE